jgi:hypothetical protein
MSMGVWFQHPPKPQKTHFMSKTFTLPTHVMPMSTDKSVIQLFKSINTKHPSQGSKLIIKAFILV